MARLLALLICVTLLVGAADAAVRPFGLGLIVGEPTGLSAKWNLGQVNALAFHLAWSLKGRVTMGADYLFHTPWLPAPWRPYLGVGGRVGLRGSDADNHRGEGDGELRLSGRGLVGVEYLFLDGHLGVAAELGLGLSFLPAVGFDVSGGLALRYYF